ncbi:MAG: Crp/Fnr family transcriptional regulator, partial [Acetobacteraceae bacterium]
DSVPLSKLRALLPDWALNAGQAGEVLERLESTARPIRRGADIIVQGRKYDSIFVLTEGFALCYRIMPDGRRHVLNVSIPGDTIGYLACFFETALYSVSTLSKAVVCSISFAAIATAFRDHPRLALTVFRSSARETAVLGEHLADVGWRNAYERLAHFLLELATRLGAIGMSDGTTFDLPLTQAKLADVLGLSIPHVNRMLRRLREDGLIELTGPRVRIVDRLALVTLADFNGSYLVRDPADRAVAHFERRDDRRYDDYATAKGQPLSRAGVSRRLILSASRL